MNAVKSPRATYSPLSSLRAFRSRTFSRVSHWRRCRKASSCLSKFYDGISRVRVIVRSLSETMIARGKPKRRRNIRGRLTFSFHFDGNLCSSLSNYIYESARGNIDDYKINEILLSNVPIVVFALRGDFSSSNVHFQHFYFYEQ